MKVSVDSVDIFTVTDHHKDVFNDSIPRDQVDLALKNAMFEILNHKYNACFNRLKREWEPKLLARGITTIPTDKDAFAELVFTQEDYKDKASRDAEVKKVTP